MGAKSADKSIGRKGTAKPAARATEPVRASGKAGNSKASLAAIRQRLLEAEQERDRLKVELAAAMARLDELERSRVEVVNRIDWVIDSLQSLIER